MKFINSFTNKITYYMFTILITLSWIFAIRSPNLNIESISNGALIVLLLVSLICLMFFRFAPHILHKFQNWKAVAISSIIILAIQLYFVVTSSTKIGYDVTSVYNAQWQHNDDFIKFYFSLNPNNLNILFMQIKLREILGLGLSWRNLSLLTLILVDLTILLNTLTVKMIKKELFFTSAYIQLMGALFFPYIIVPYTDTWSMFFVAFYLFIFALINKIDKSYLKSILALILGIIVALACFVKPSAVIPFIAIIIWWSISTSKLFQRIILLVLALSTFASTTYILSNKVANQNYITITPDKSKPILHFISIGMEGSGGYSLEQDQAMMNAKNMRERNEYSIKRIQKNLNRMGPIGYLKWLVFKQKNNTSDGTLGWTADGNLSEAIPKTPIQNFYYTTGKYNKDFLFISQLAWIALLTLVFLGFKNKTSEVQFFRLALLGGLIFLLIFEGGRSRYLIQFLPCLIVLASLCFPNTCDLLKNIRSAIKK